MALRVLKRTAGGNFTTTTVATLDAMKAEFQAAFLDRTIVDCIGEDDSKTIMAERWFVLFMGRAGFTG